MENERRNLKTKTQGRKKNHKMIFLYHVDIAIQPKVKE